MNQHQKIEVGVAIDNRIEIEVTGNEKQVNDQIIKVLARSDIQLYQKFGELVTISDDGTGPRIRYITHFWLREKISDKCRLLKLSKKEEFNEITAQTFSQQILARTEYPELPTLKRIINAPIITDTGYIQSKKGYDPKTQNYLTDSFEFDDNITITKKLEKLLDLISDFPLKTNSDISAWLASLFTPFIQFVGNKPLFLYNGNVMGCGKGKLANTIGLIVTGQQMPTQSLSTSESENRKVITATLRLGKLLILFDNLKHKIGGSSIEAAITTQMWADRILGRSEIVEMETDTTFYATANNATLSPDMVRRTLPITIESPLERPEERRDIKRTNLEEHIINHRREYIDCVISILKATQDSVNRPNANPWGSFEEWSKQIRNRIVALDLPDPIETRKTLIDADPESESLKIIVSVWGDRQYTSNELVQEIEVESELGKALNLIINTPTSRGIGATLTKYLNRVIDEKQFKKETKSKIAHWFFDSVK